MKSNKRNLLCLFIVSILSFFPNIWVSSAGLMEARNFVTAREMVRYHNWIIPTMNGNYRFEKPPLPTWITAFFMKIFNTTSNETVLRLPIAILGVILIFFIYYLVKIATRDESLAFISGLVSSTTFMIIKLSNENTWDMFSYGLMFMALTLIFKGLSNNSNKPFIFASLFISGSLLSKGPVPIYGMMLPFFIAYCITYRDQNFKRNLFKLVSSVFLGFVIASLWPITAYISQKDLFLSVMNKEANTWGSKHVESIFYYLDYIVYIGVWMLFVVASFIKPWAEKRCKDKKFFTFIFLWNIFAFILISLIKMKKKRYGVPLFILSPIMASQLIYYYSQKDWTSFFKKEKYFLKFHFVLMWIISIGVPVLFYIKGVYRDKVSLVYFVIICIIFLPIAFEFGRAILSKLTLKKGLIYSGLLMILVNIFVTWFIELEIRNGGHLTKHRYLSTLKSREEYKEPYYTFDNNKITNVWNVGRRIKTIEDITLLPDSITLIESKNKKDINKILGEYYIIDNNETYYKYDDDNDTINLYHLIKKD